MYFDKCELLFTGFYLKLEKMINLLSDYESF